MSLSEKFYRQWKQDFPHLSPGNCRLLLGLSGGVDSVVMTELVSQCGFDFSIAHCNFQLRGEESDRDELFVKGLAEKHGKEIFVKRFDTKSYAAETKLSIQESARELRYAWFKELINDQSPDSNAVLALAHNADDNIETMLLFFFRGTGIHGLKGIPLFDRDRKLIRPLLFAQRSDILQYANERNLSWVEDSSNASEKYTRNFFRNTVVPLVEEHFSNVKGNLLHNIKRFNEAAELYELAIDLHKKKLLEYRGNEVHIPVLKLQKIKPLDTVLWEIIKDYDFGSHQVDEVKKLFNSENSSYVQSYSHRIILNRKWLIIAPKRHEDAAYILIEEKDQVVLFRDGSLKIETLTPAVLPTNDSRNVARLDATNIRFPLLVRRWKQGDYFYPLGMQKKKKLSRFFIDQKLSPTQKENTWVLEMDKKILWIVGHRIDDRYKITSATKEILKFEFIPG